MGTFSKTINKAYFVHQHSTIFLIDYVLYIIQLLTMNRPPRTWWSFFTGRGTLGKYNWKEMERSFHFEDYSLPEGDSYASIEVLIIEICLAKILIFGSAIPQRTLDFHAIMIQSVWDQEGKKPLSSHHIFPSFEFHPMYVSACTCWKELGIQYWIWIWCGVV
jgi:hypothetical protein